MITLYAQHFRLKEAPFSIAPNPRFLFMSEQHREALAHLLYGIGHDGGFVLLTGEVGTGKTTLCRCLLEKVPEDTDVAFIINPRLSVVDLLANICDELHISYNADKLNNRLLVDAINHYLLERHAAGRHTVLVIDEAQNLDTEVLEQLRLLTNLETHERKLLQIILLGQPELQNKLNIPELRQLSQRITARYHLQALNRADMQSYITHRLAVAGSDQALFSPSAMNFVYRRSQGIPRLINLICDRAMLGAFALGRPRIERDIAIQASREVFGEQTKESRSYRPGAIWAVAAVLLILVAWATGRWMAPQSVSLAGVSATGSARPVESVLVAPAPAEPAASEHRIAAQPTHNSAEEPLARMPMESMQAEPEIAQATAPEETITEAAVTQAPAAAVLPTAGQQAAGQQTAGQQTAPIAWVKGGFLHDRPDAFNDLFTIWGIALPIQSDPCTFAKTQGLSCQRFSGDVDLLSSLNRPAIIDWHREDGGMSYITAVSMDETSILAISDDRIFKLPLAQLRSHWRGGFTILWHTPPGYRSSIRPGTVGPLAKWLNGRLSALESDVPVVPDQVSGQYLGEMVQRLRRFQTDSGLLPDGVAGPQTLIHLNTALHESGPRLQSSTEHPAQATAAR